MLGDCCCTPYTVPTVQGRAKGASMSHLQSSPLDSLSRLSRDQQLEDTWSGRGGHSWASPSPRLPPGPEKAFAHRRHSHHREHSITS